jgi:undecaprenyl-diphosphatase
VTSSLRGDGVSRVTKSTQRIVRRREDGVAAGVGLAVVILCGLVARDGTVGPIELAVFHAINGLTEALSPVMRIARCSGSSPDRWSRRSSPSCADGGSRCACLLVTAGKLAAERVTGSWCSAASGHDDSGAIVRGNAGSGFFIGHVIAHRPRGRDAVPARPVARSWAVLALVAFARIYLGAHAPLDVLGGVGVGLIVGGLVNLIVGVETPEPAVDERAYQ